MKPSVSQVENLAMLAELFPGIFIADSWRSHKALAWGIDRQLVDAGVLTAEEAETLLRAYVRRRCYLLAVAAGGFRHNLDGSVAGEIAAEHVAAAKAALAFRDAHTAKVAEAARLARESERTQQGGRTGKSRPRIHRSSPSSPQSR
jgi:sRNA-binding protein